ncbi:THAP domain-containing protein 1 B-like [Ornithodoros turicata]|uniref:THAP domain-containing protein 1 B-like n=1 Tax=Ornithodoros turicata TaxID=34597 RepID=UPI00313926AD
MTGCSAFGCSSNTSHGKRLFRVPIGRASAERRKAWLKIICRANFYAGANSRLCEDHFEEDQFENHRADGRKLLKQNAIPTIYGAAIREKMLQAPLKREVSRTRKVKAEEQPEDADLRDTDSFVNQGELADGQSGIVSTNMWLNTGGHEGANYQMVFIQYAE